jgi:hypothetical protein
MARHGYIGTAPFHPSRAISSRVLELLRILTAHCPRLSVQSFVKSLSELHCICTIYVVITVTLISWKITYFPTLRDLVSVAFDVYLELGQRIKHHIRVELGRDAPLWQLQNA